jgi:hypothetical protein
MPSGYFDFFTDLFHQPSCFRFASVPRRLSLFSSRYACPGDDPATILKFSQAGSVHEPLLHLFASGGCSAPLFAIRDAIERAELIAPLRQHFTNRFGRAVQTPNRNGTTDSFRERNSANCSWRITPFSRPRRIPQIRNVPHQNRTTALADNRCKFLRDE